MTQAMVAIDGDGLPAVEAYGREQMQAKLSEMKGTLDVVQTFFHDVMRPSRPGKADGDYGVIPGTEKPSLLKPGAEKLCELYGFAQTIRNIERTSGPDGFYEVEVTIGLVSKRTGNLVGEGIGSANTFEDRYRWRWVYSNSLPEGFDPTGLVKQTGKNNRGPWTRYRTQNPDMYSLHNTVLKQAKKRALVDATLAATRSSGLFTQDQEDFDDWLGAAGEGTGDSDMKMPASTLTVDEDGVIDGDAPSPDETPWQTLTRLMKDADLTSSALKPFMSFSESGLSTWLDANHGKAVADLVAMAKGV